MWQSRDPQAECFTRQAVDMISGLRQCCLKSFVALTNDAECKALAKEDEGPAVVAVMPERCFDAKCWDRVKSVHASLSAHDGVVALYDECRASAVATAQPCRALKQEGFRLQNELRRIAVEHLSAAQQLPCYLGFEDER